MDELLTILQNPNVAFLLLMIGGLGLATELTHPNVVTGVLGVSALVLAAIGLTGLPVSWLGLGILVVGFVLLVLETQVTSFGLLALGGIICIAFGASELFSTVPGAPPVQVSPAVIVSTLGVLALAVLGLSLMAARTRRMRGPMVQLGVPPHAGTSGIVQAPLAPLGTVQLGGETWTARTSDERLVPRSAPVHLVGFDGLVAIVEPDDPDDATAFAPLAPSAAAAAADRS